MAENIGIAPPDKKTDVGRFRLGAGDAEYTPLNPPQPGYGNYANWSDDQIEVLLDLAGGSVARAIAIAYRQLASHLTSMGATIRTEDLTYSNKETVASWLSLADYWDKTADAEEERAIDNYFDLVDNPREEEYCWPEASPRPVRLRRDEWIW